MYRSFVRRDCGTPSAATPSACAVPRAADLPVHCVLEAIYRRERAGLLHYLRARVGEDLALDLAQEVFLRASTSCQIAHLVNPGGFLHRIARNMLIDRARRRSCRIATMPLNEAIDAPCAAEQENELEARDLMISLERALTALPERTRTIFAMHRFEEKAYREIQRELGISLAAVEYHMMKALAHLRESLKLAA
ncbi:MAG: sigma-70 family RNA polymerase sigma factor [Alphaproteobacteria bacterium]|nr:sigma-70 family RNA polymerase sigma factor [Alphaproteobacteria bacterium]